ncbi:DNA/RNA non-specific endonuclease [Agromyces soli]
MCWTDAVASEPVGYDPSFLGIEVPLPDASADALLNTVLLNTVLLSYVHFSVRLDRERRLARVTGVNVDGARLIELERGGERWRFDDRVPVEWQAGPAIYADNDLDRGHLVRRRDPVWGDADAAGRAAAELAESDTFHYTNAAPQAAGFNQSKELWLGLEDHVLAYADANGLRLSVFTAPVFSIDDPPYRGIRVPLRFFKIVAWRSGEALAAAGFVLDQTPLVDTREARPSVEAGATVPDLGPYRTFQVPVADIAALTGLELGPLVAADRMPRALAAAGWRRLEASDQILL